MSMNCPSRVALVVIALMANVSCRQTYADRERTAVAPTAPLSSDGSCHLDLIAERGDDVFFVLGMRTFMGLQEGDDTVEGFFCNEQSIGQLFRRRASALAVAQGIGGGLQEKVIQNCLVSYHSRLLADGLNSCYQYELKTPEGGDPSMKTLRVGKAVLNPALFYYDTGAVASPVENGLPAHVFDRRRALVYIAGVWARHAQGADFVFSSMFNDLADMVANLLVNLGCTNVRVEHTVGLIPGGTSIHFERTAEVDTWLRRRW